MQCANLSHRPSLVNNCRVRVSTPKNESLAIPLAFVFTIDEVGLSGDNVNMRWQDYIEERKDVMLGKPVFKGTRLTVEHVLKELGAGLSEDELLANYPTLKPEHLQAAMLYAAALVTMDETIYQ
jgi:uncharacterized protein (DUF433 family)